MARAIFQTIYDNVKQSIDDGTYAYQSYLPSETELTQLFDCSRMTVRRAISMLAADGYVLPQQGKGMRVIRNISDEKSRGGGGLETFKEIATSRGFELKTVTTVFELLVCSKALSKITGFPEGCELTRAKRIRYANGHAVCSDDSYYLSSQVPGLTPEIVNDSIYRYLEEDLGIKIATGKRDVTIEHPTPEDARVLDLDDFNALAVIRGQTYNADGILMEYTEYPGLYNIDFKIFANVTGATPDGRRFRDAIAEHCSPTPGAAKKGPTAILNSASTLPMKEGFASSVLHLTLDKNGYSMGADRIKIIDTLLRASEKKKIPVLSLTMYDKAELLDAQLHPEKHQDLIVRVWGFQARFTELDKELQDHIINRIS